MPHTLFWGSSVFLVESQESWAGSSQVFSSALFLHWVTWSLCFWGVPGLLHTMRENSTFVCAMASKSLVVAAVWDVAACNCKERLLVQKAIHFFECLDIKCMLWTLGGCGNTHHKGKRLPWEWADHRMGRVALGNLLALGECVCREMHYGNVAWLCPMDFPSMGEPKFQCKKMELFDLGTPRCSAFQLHLLFTYVSIRLWKLQMLYWLYSLVESALISVIPLKSRDKIRSFLSKSN